MYVCMIGYTLGLIIVLKKAIVTDELLETVYIIETMFYLFMSLYF